MAKYLDYDGLDRYTDYVKDQLSGKANSTHSHSASNITSGTLGVARGGTGVTSNPSMLTNLGSTSAASVFAASPRPGVTGTLPLGNGGTGATSVAGILSNLGIADKVVASGSVGSQYDRMWHYIKYDSGLAICYGQRDVGTTTTDLPWGSLYYHGSWTLPDYPFAFIDTPAFLAFRINGYEGWLSTTAAGTATTPPQVTLIRPNVLENISYTVAMAALGRWK